MVSSKIKVLIGITGGIAAYKILILIRSLIRYGAEVKVIMTENSKQFVTPLSIESLSGNPVYDNMFSRRESFTHISLREWADVLIIAPATANIIGKLSNGIADDLLSTTAMSFNKKKFICPAMNVEMWNSKTVKRNIEVVSSDGWQIIGPDTGQLACGVTGSGRMVEPEVILNKIIEYDNKKPFGKIVITAGATRQPIDAVRFISNSSTGKMGVAVAEASLKFFNKVVLIHASITEKIPKSITAIEALTAEDMLKALKNELSDSDALVMSAAVSDFTPEDYIDKKLKKESKDTIELKLKRTSDILKETIKLRNKNNVFTVGFAMETDNLKENAQKKLKEKQLDCILANPLNETDAGFASDKNRVIFIDKFDKCEEWETQPKKEIAEKLLERINQYLKK